MHVHTLKLVSRSTTVVCEGCDLDLRLATYDEAVFVQQTDGWAPDGPMVGPTNVVVVPADFSLWPEAEPDVNATTFPDGVDLRPDQKWLTRPDDGDPELGWDDDADRFGGPHDGE